MKDVERMTVVVGQRRFTLHLVNRLEHDKRTYRTKTGELPYIALQIFAAGNQEKFDSVLNISKRKKKR